MRVVRLHISRDLAERSIISPYVEWIGSPYAIPSDSKILYPELPAEVMYDKKGITLVAGGFITVSEINLFDAMRIIDSDSSDNWKMDNIIYRLVNNADHYMRSHEFLAMK